MGLKFRLYLNCFLFFIFRTFGMDGDQSWVTHLYIGSFIEPRVLMITANSSKFWCITSVRRNERCYTNQCRAHKNQYTLSKNLQNSAETNKYCIRRPVL